MKELYELILHSQLGPRPGLLSLVRHGPDVSGTLSLAGYENSVSGQWDGVRTFTLLHPLRTAVGTHQCRSVLTLAGETITGTAELEECTMHWSGRRLPANEPKEGDCE